MDIDNLLQNSFESEVKSLVRNVNQIKTFQVTGNDSVRMYRIFSQDASDVSFTNVQFNNTAFTLTFTPDDTELNPGIVYRMEYTYTEDPDDGSVEIFYQRNKVEGSIQTWTFAIEGSDFFPNSLVTLKFYFWASGNGTFSVESI